MAMLRNLRNMTRAGVGPKYQTWIVKKLTDERTVINSRQFPVRFFSAYDVLNTMEKELERYENAPPPEDFQPPKGRVRTRVRDRQNWEKYGKPEKRRGQAGRKEKDVPPKEIKYTSDVLSRYRKALDTAIKIATRHNVKPISGKTYLFCDVGPKMSGYTSVSALDQMLEVGLLLGLMCKYSCEKCIMTAYSVDSQRVIELEKGTILDNLKSISQLAKASNAGLDTNSNPPSRLNIEPLYKDLRDRVHIDNLIVVGQDYTDDGTGWDELKVFIAKYRQVVNPKLLFVLINLSVDSYRYLAQEEGDASRGKSSHPNDVHVTGYSDNILRYIAERGDSGQLNHVDNIDKAYGLRELQVAAVAGSSCSKQSAATNPEIPLPIAGPLQRWRTARVFISSTFRDMHGERDLLTRFAFPELRARAKKRFLNVYEVDLRWGVTEEQTRQNRSIEICLSEVSRCDYFVGMLGDRYGYCPPTYEAPDMQEFDWLKEYPRGRSITELEMQHAALCDATSAVGKAFFYFRDSAFNSEVPSSCLEDFVAESAAARDKMVNLKKRIQTSGLEVFDGYPCRFGGVVDNKPVTTNLDQLGLRVINNLWNAFLVDYPAEEAFLDELSHEGALHQAFLDAHVAEFSGRKVQIRQCLDLMDACTKGLVVVSGKSGCGKTALMSRMIQQYLARVDQSDRNHVVAHLVGAAPGSSNVLPLLRRICLELDKRFALQRTVPEDYNKLVSEFPEFLKASAVHCSRSPLVIFIDGLDQMEDAYQSKNMEWLPKDIPKDVMFVVSTVEDAPSHKALLRREPPTLTLKPLDLLDKATVVRRMLAVHRKTLDESPFNNQMKLLVSKREANLPLFLSLACEELRVFGVFEKVSERLKSMSHTITALLQEVMQRLEDDHGRDLLATAMTLLVCARDGLFEDEMHSLLSLHSAFDGAKYCLQDVKNVNLSADKMLPRAVFAQLMRSLRGFVRPIGEKSANHLSLAHAEISKAVRQRYLKGLWLDSEPRLHSLLAGYFLQEADPHRNGSWSGHKPRAFSELPFHLTHAMAYSDLQSVLCSLPFIHAKCSMGLAAQLLYDFIGGGGGDGLTPSRTTTREREKFLAKPLVQDFRSFVSRNLHIISSLPVLTWQQAANEPSDSSVCQSMADAMKKQSQSASGSRSLLKWTNKRVQQDDCAMTITGFTQPITCLAMSIDEGYFASGGQDCTSKLFEWETGKEVMSFVGHYDTITDCCFVGRKKLVTASIDSTLSLWDVQQGHRIAVLKGHRRRVSSCCHGNLSSLIVSASWDCSLKLWDDRDGRLVATLSEASPINCVACHRDGRLVVTGGWDATLKIWHLEDRKRLGILRGHTSSVQAVAYSPSGAHIASASLDGTVKLWSSTTGTQVGGLDGHIMPINRIAFSPNGRQLVTVSDDRRVKVWSGNLGKKLSTFGLDRYGYATATAISPDGYQVATGYHSGAVRLYEANSGAQLWEAEGQHEARIKGLLWVMVPHGQLELLVGWTTGHVKLLSALTGSVTLSLTINPVRPATSIAYSTPNRLAAAAYEDNTICLWRLPLQRKTRQETLEPYAKFHASCNGTVLCCGFSTDGTKLATGSKDATVQVWSMESDALLGQLVRPLKEIHAAHTDWVTALAWSDTSDYMVTASNDFTLKLWDMETYKEKHQLKGHTSAINAVAYSQGCVVSACFDGSVRVWSHRGVEITTLYGHYGRVNSCDIFVAATQAENIFDDLEPQNPGSASWVSRTAAEEWNEEHKKKILDKVELVRLEKVTVATASDDAMTFLWKPLQGNELASLSGHSDSVVDAAVSSSGDVITCSMDKTIKLWKPTLEAKILPVNHKGEVTCCACSPNGKYAVSTSRNGELSLWTLPKIDSAEDDLPTVSFSNKVSDTAINAVCFVSNSRFALGSDGGVATIWEVQAPTPPNTVVRVRSKQSLDTTGHADRSPISCLAYDAVRGYLYTAHWSSVICVFHLDSGKLRKKYQREQSPDWILDLKMLSANAIIASLANGEIQYFPNLDLERPTCFSVLKPTADSLAHGYREPCWVTTCCGIDLRHNKTLGLSPSDAERKVVVVAGDSRGYLSVCDVATEEVLIRKKVHTGAVHDITVCEDVICTASEDSTVKLWSRRTLKQVGQFYCRAAVSAVVTSNHNPNHTSLICGDKLGNVYFLEWHSSNKH